MEEFSYKLLITLCNFLLCEGNFEAQNRKGHKISEYCKLKAINQILMIYCCVLKNRKYRFYRGCDRDKSGKTYFVLFENFTMGKTLHVSISSFYL